MAKKIGGFLGLLSGFIVWHMVGGIGGLLLAIFLVVPIASALFIGLLSAVGGGRHTSSKPVITAELIEGRKCPSCAEEIRPEARVCPYCGHQFAEVGDAKAVEIARSESDLLKKKLERDPQNEGDGFTRRCPMCAETVRVRAVVCRFCGHHFSDEDITQLRSELLARAAALQEQGGAIGKQTQQEAEQRLLQRIRRCGTWLVVVGAIYLTLSGVSLLAQITSARPEIGVFP